MVKLEHLTGGVWPEDQRTPKSRSASNLGSLAGVGVPEGDMYTKKWQSVWLLPITQFVISAACVTVAGIPVN